MKKLVLFDIDGTLMRGVGAVVSSYRLAFQEIFGIDASITDVDCSGRTDPEIVTEVLTARGFDQEAISQGLPRLFASYIVNLKREIPNTDDAYVCPGIQELLDELAGRPLVLGILSGNLQESSRLKLSLFDLNRYFQVGAFGSDSAVRSELVGIALKRTEDRFGLTFSGKDIVIIGDSVRDVHCGRDYGVKSIAVATGVTPYEKLAAEKPDHLFNNLSGTEEVLDAILG